MKYKKYIAWVTVALVIGLIALFIANPILIKSIVAKYKSTDHFLVLDEDARIRYEDPARKYAITLSKVLSDSQNAVERTLNAQFKSPIEVYICSSQKSFNQYVFLSKNVRGAVYWGKLFLSPGAFNRGSLSNLTEHELTHYLFYTHLGEKAHIKGVPLWFREGIAVFVANGGGEYTKGSSVYDMMSDKERESFLSGRTNFWFTSGNPQDAVKNGVANWLLYRVGALFVHYLHDTNPEGFGKLIHNVLVGEPFEHEINETYARDLSTLIFEFRQYLESHNKNSQATLNSERLL